MVIAGGPGQAHGKMVMVGPGEQGLAMVRRPRLRRLQPPTPGTSPPTAHTRPQAWPGCRGPVKRQDVRQSATVMSFLIHKPTIVIDGLRLEHCVSTSNDE